MKKLLLVLVVMGLPLFLIGCGAQPTTTDGTTPDTTTSTETTQTPSETVALDGYQVYTNEAGFEIQYPSDWTFEEDAFGSLVMIYSPQAEGDLFRENIGVITEELPTPMALDDYYSQAKTYLIDFIPDFKEVSYETITVDGKDARKVVYQGSQQGYTLKRQQIFFLDGNTVYVLTYTASADTFDTFVAVMENATRSFKMTK